MIRMFPDLVDKVRRVVAENLRIDKLAMVDGGEEAGGEGLPDYVPDLAGSAVRMMEQVEDRDRCGSGAHRDPQWLGRGR